MIAKCIRAEWNSRHLDLSQHQNFMVNERTIYSIMNRITVELAIENPHFDRDEFERACGF